MSSNNLFGQYYNNLGNHKAYTNVDYKCVSGSSGESTLVFNGSEAQLLDNQGNILGRIDLSKIAAGPMLSWTSGSIILNPGEVKLIEGLEYGKLLKHVYFEIPPVYITTLGDAWKYLVNVKFTILLNVDLDLREYDVSTTTSIEDKASIVDRVQTLINEIGAEDNIKISIQEAEDEFGTQRSYLVFESLVHGYDFIITDFKFFNNRIVKMEVDALKEDDTIGGLKEIVEAEDNIVFGDETSFEDSKAFLDEDGNLIAGGTDVGHYDNNDDPANENSADHYYVGPSDDDFDEDKPKEDQEPEHEDGGSYDGSDGAPEDEDDGYTTVMRSSEFLVARDKDLEIDAFKYPNGAARAWLIVPEWPISVESGFLSLKLNHVADKIVIPEPAEGIDCRGYYGLTSVDVFASERSEVERHNLKQFKYWLEENFTYMDSKNGSVIEVNHEKDFCKCPDLNLEIHNPHIGMYRYLDYVSMNNLWVNVGDFYGLVTNADTDDIDEKNLANSVFLYNRNEFPVKVSYFICA